MPATDWWMDTVCPHALLAILGWNYSTDHHTCFTSGRSWGEFCVEVEGIVSSGAGRLERGRDLSVPQLLPVDCLEEGVCLDVLYPIGPVAQPVLRIALEEHSEKWLGLGRKELRHPQFGPISTGRGGKDKITVDSFKTQQPFGTS